MPNRRAQCPECGILLNVPEGCEEHPVRCGQCHHRFRLAAARVPVAEEDIASWLMEAREADEKPIKLEDHVDEAPTDPDDITSGRTNVLNALNEKIHLLRAGGGGALFEFPAVRLNEIDFRCAMPRKCLRCGARAHIHPHLIIYTSQLRDSISLEAEHSAEKVIRSAEQYDKLPNGELLAVLPNVPNVIHPADLPMPYWLCDLCSSAGMIQGQIQVNTSTGEGFCRLLIRNLRRAEEFLTAAGGKNTDSHRELNHKIAETAESPWDVLPLVVQHRLEQWFHPTGDEAFLGYIPDRSRVRTEDGMDGLLLSSKRFIFHTRMRHRECDVDDPLVLTLSMNGRTGQLKVKTPTWGIDRFAVDREGVERLRRTLAKSEFQAKWL